MARRRKHMYSRAVHRQGTMNDTEQWYYDTVLLPSVHSGVYAKCEFERIKVILVHPDPTTKPKRRESTYLPDFYCVTSDGITEIHETKGREDEADRLKIKMAAELFPEWKWFLVCISRKKIRKIEEF